MFQPWNREWKPGQIDLIDVTAELDKRVSNLEDSSLTHEVLHIKSVELEKRLSKLENVSQDTNLIDTGGTFSQLSGCG